MKQPKVSKWFLAQTDNILWRLTWIFLLMLAVSIAFGWALQRFKVSDVPWSLLISLPILFSFIGGVRYAYRCGLRDGRLHPSDPQ